MGRSDGASSVRFLWSSGAWCRLGHFQRHGPILGGYNVINIEPIVRGGVDQIIDSVPLIDFFHKGIHRHRLLPELQIGNKFVSFTVVTERNIVIILLRNDNVSHDGFTPMSPM